MEINLGIDIFRNIGRAEIFERFEALIEIELKKFKRLPRFLFISDKEAEIIGDIAFYRDIPVKLRSGGKAEFRKYREKCISK